MSEASKSVIQILTEERDKLNRAIAVLQGADAPKRRGRPPGKKSAKKAASRRGRPQMTAAEKRAVSDRMKQYWAARRKAKKK